MAGIVTQSLKAESHVDGPLMAQINKVKAYMASAACLFVPFAPQAFECLPSFRSPLVLGKETTTTKTNVQAETLFHVQQRP